MPVDLNGLITDLRAEGDEVADLLEPLTEEQWRLPTPARGWCVKDQVSHLAYFDEAATTAATDPDRFRDDLRGRLEQGGDVTEMVARENRERSGTDLLDWFRAARARLLEAFTGVDPAVKLPWYGPTMSPASSLTARLMETWAHGLDVAETFGRPPSTGPRLRHIVHLGYATIGWSFVVHGEEAPAEPIRLELTAPDGTAWNRGPEDAANRVTGTALDFCLLATQRRHPDDLGLTATGPVAERYVRLAQIFAGPPGRGPERGRRPPLSTAHRSCL